MRSIPSDYFNYYYFRNEVFRDQQAAPRTRSEVIMNAVPGYWDHYREQAESSHPHLDPARSRGGIHELELAIDVMSAYYNDTGARLPVNLPNVDNALPGFDAEDRRRGPLHREPEGLPHRPATAAAACCSGITRQLADYQMLAAKAAWEGTRADAIRALIANPLVPDLSVAEHLYDEMAAAHAAYLPERLLR